MRVRASCILVFLGLTSVIGSIVRREVPENSVNPIKGNKPFAKDTRRNNNNNNNKNNNNDDAITLHIRYNGSAVEAFIPWKEYTTSSSNDNSTSSSNDNSNTTNTQSYNCDDANNSSSKVPADPSNCVTTKRSTTPKQIVLLVHGGEESDNSKILTGVLGGVSVVIVIGIIAGAVWLYNVRRGEETQSTVYNSVPVQTSMV